MLLFAFFSIPLAYFCFSAWYNHKVFKLRLFFNGFLTALPAVLFWLILKPLYKPIWGSWLLIFSFFLKYWLFPYGFALACFFVFVRFSKQEKYVKLPLGYKEVHTKTEKDKIYDKALPFYFGFLTVFTATDAILSYDNIDSIHSILIPLCILATTFAFPVLLESTREKMWITMTVATIAFLLISVGNALFYLRQELYGLLVSVIFISCCFCYVAFTATKARVKEKL